MSGTKSATKRDVELAEIQRKANRDVTLARGGVWVAMIIASAVPLYALHWVVDPLAGKTTNVDVNIVVTISLALSLVWNFGQLSKGRSRRDELQRQRGRLDQLESELRRPRP